MSAATASILGPIIGAIAGLAGGAFAALAAIRASQIASRAPIANTLFRLAKAQVALAVSMTRGDVATDDRDKALRNVHTIWNQLTTQQTILCPSKRIGGLLALMKEVSQNTSGDSRHMLQLSGHLQKRIAQMVAVYSQTFLRVCARREEKKIIREWLASKDSEILTSDERAKITTLC
jgi:hypothetical protein